MGAREGEGVVGGAGGGVGIPRAACYEHVSAYEGVGHDRGMFTETITWVPNGIFGGIFGSGRRFECTSVLLLFMELKGDGNTRAILGISYSRVHVCTVVSQFFLRYYIHQNLPLDYSIIHNEM